MPQINPLPGFIFVFIGRAIRKRGEEESREVPGLGGNRPVGNRQPPNQPSAPRPMERKPPPTAPVERKPPPAPVVPMPQPIEVSSEPVDEGRLLEDVIESIGGSDVEAYQPRSSSEMLKASEKRPKRPPDPTMDEPVVIDLPLPEVTPIDLPELQLEGAGDDEYKPMSSAEMVERARRRFNPKPPY